MRQIFQIAGTDFKLININILKYFNEKANVIQKENLIRDMNQKVNYKDTLKLKIARSKVKSSIDGLKKRLFTLNQKTVNWKTELYKLSKLKYRDNVLKKDQSLFLEK